MRRSLYFNKVACWRASRHSCFPENFIKFYTPFLQTQSYKGMKYYQFSEAAACRCSLKYLLSKFTEKHIFWNATAG